METKELSMELHNIFRYTSNFDDAMIVTVENKLFAYSRKDDINQMDSYGYTLLHYAAIKSVIPPELLNLLLTFNPNLYVFSLTEKKTALEYAFERGHQEKTKIIIDAGFDIHKKAYDMMSFESKFYDIFQTDPVFYESTFNELKTFKTFTQKPSYKSSKSDVFSSIRTMIEGELYDLVSVRLRVELERRLRTQINEIIGHQYAFLTTSFSLHDMLAHSVQLGFLTLDKREELFRIKQVLNYYCHDSVSERKIDFFFTLNKDQKKEFFENALFRIQSL